MNNAEKFKQIFGLYATEVWSMPESDFLAWLNRAAETAHSVKPNTKKSYWIISSDGYYPYCSKCGKEPDDGKMSDFCPSCGADMRGKQNG